MNGWYRYRTPNEQLYNEQVCYDYLQQKDNTHYLFYLIVLDIIIVNQVVRLVSRYLLRRSGFKNRLKSSKSIVPKL